MALTILLLYIHVFFCFFFSFLFFYFFPQLVDEEGDEILILIWIWFIVQMMALTLWKKFWFRILNSWSWWGRRSMFSHCLVTPIKTHVDSFLTYNCFTFHGLNRFILTSIVSVFIFIIIIIFLKIWDQIWFGSGYFDWIGLH